jgi:hypothetical protein
MEREEHLWIFGAAPGIVVQAEMEREVTDALQIDLGYGMEGVKPIT